MNADLLKEIVEQNRVDGERGIYSVCSAHRFVLEASLQQARSDNSPLLIESITRPSQFMPHQYKALRAGALGNDPRSLTRHRIQKVVSMYARASGLSM